METLRVIPDLERQGMKEGKYSVVEYQNQLIIGGMADGTAGGKPIVMIGLDMEDHILVAQTTLTLFLTAADALKAKYGDPR